MTYYFADILMLSYILAFLKIDKKNSPTTCCPKALNIVWGSQTGK
jgi:hypothetical protein